MRNFVVGLVIATAVNLVGVFAMLDAFVAQPAAEQQAQITSQLRSLKQRADSTAAGLITLRLNYDTLNDFVRGGGYNSAPSKDDSTFRVIENQLNTIELGLDVVINNANLQSSQMEAAQLTLDEMLRRSDRNYTSINSNFTFIEMRTNWIIDQVESTNDRLSSVLFR